MTHEDLRTRLRRELGATEPPLRLDLRSLHRAARDRRRRRAATAAIGVAASVTLAGALVLGLDGRDDEAQRQIATDPTGLDHPVRSPDDPRVVELGRAVRVTGRGSRTVQLGPRPQDASVVTLSVTCLTAGTVRYAERNSLSCSLSTPASTDVLIDLAPGQESIRVTAADDVEWKVRATYARVDPEKP